MRSFIIGSFRHGEPRHDSDLDLVILVDEGTKLVLEENCAELSTELAFNTDYAPIRFGRLNLIPVIEEAEFKAWRRTAEKLEARKPVTPEEAVAAYREALNR